MRLIDLEYVYARNVYASVMEGKEPAVQVPCGSVY